jgi:hypothetical protein
MEEELFERLLVLDVRFFFSLAIAYCGGISFSSHREPVLSQAYHSGEKIASALVFVHDEKQIFKSRSVVIEM